jgi:hypothetical protein
MLQRAGILARTRLAVHDSVIFCGALLGLMIA